MQDYIKTNLAPTAIFVRHEKNKTISDLNCAAFSFYAEAQHQTDGMKGMQMGDTSAKMSMQMSSGHPLNLPMNRDGSGTATL